MREPITGFSGDQPVYEEKVVNISKDECCDKDDVAKLNESLVKAYQEMVDKLRGEYHMAGNQWAQPG